MPGLSWTAVMQSKGFSGNVRKAVDLQMYRIGRDYDGKLTLVVNRPGARGGKGNALTLHLRLPPTPGALHHFGTTGIYGKMYSDHMGPLTSPPSPCLSL